jgi:hypothetical protein
MGANGINAPKHIGNVASIRTCLVNMSCTRPKQHFFIWSVRGKL